MLHNLNATKNLTESIIINNASKDYIEYLINDILNVSEKSIVFINQGIKPERLKKNFNFLNSGLRVEFVEEAEEIYSFTASSLLEVANQNKALHNVLNNDFDVLCIDYRMLLKKLPKTDFFNKFIELKCGEKFGHSNLVSMLCEYGFFRCDTVFDFGEFAVRGFVIDIGTLNGFFRIEFDGESISAITQFNTETQRKNPNDAVQNLKIFKIKQAVLKNNWEQEIKINAMKNGIAEVNGIISDISNFRGLGLGGFLPLFHKETSNLLDFIKKDVVFVKWSNLSQTLDFFEANLKDTHSLYAREGKSFLSTKFLLEDKESILNKLDVAVEVMNFL